MPAIKSIDHIAEKYARVTPGRTPDYETGVRNPRRDWLTATIEQMEAWVAGIQEAIANGSWARGLEKAGTEKWKRKTLEKGPARWGQGVRMAQPDFHAGFKPYRDEIERIELPPRGPKGDPRNLERVRIIAEALHALKMRIG